MPDFAGNWRIIQVEKSRGEGVMIFSPGKQTMPKDACRRDSSPHGNDTSVIYRQHLIISLHKEGIKV
jgi:hypothetical protein